MLNLALLLLITSGLILFTSKRKPSPNRLLTASATLLFSSLLYGAADCHGCAAMVLLLATFYVVLAAVRHRTERHQRDAKPSPRK